ncbi:MAG TPA: hypothetical protein VHM47_04110 [Actinomycetota bacterium]|jgi:hypothetical protein|nr:hypothetical protein [Actinomycetota bacterium]
MNKRSAIVTAGGVVASFVAGAVSVSSGLGLGNSVTAATAAPTSGPTASRVKPVIKHRRIVVHKKAPKARAAGPQTVVLPAPASSIATAPISMTSGSHASGSGELDDATESGGDD